MLKAQIEALTSRIASNAATGGADKIAEDVALALHLIAAKVDELDERTATPPEPEWLKRAQEKAEDGDGGGE